MPTTFSRQGSLRSSKAVGLTVLAAGRGQRIKNRRPWGRRSTAGAAAFDRCRDALRVSHGGDAGARGFSALLSTAGDAGLYVVSKSVRGIANQRRKPVSGSESTWWSVKWCPFGLRLGWGTCGAWYHRTRGGGPRRGGMGGPTQPVTDVRDSGLSMASLGRHCCFRKSTRIPDRVRKHLKSPPLDDVQTIDIVHRFRRPPRRSRSSWRSRGGDSCPSSEPPVLHCRALGECRTPWRSLPRVSRGVPGPALLRRTSKRRRRARLASTSSRRTRPRSVPRSRRPTTIATFTSSNWTTPAQPRQ